MVNNNCLVSVVIPVYNVVPYLRECLDSVIQQSYNKLEIIIVDDGSTDESGSICDEYAANDQRIIVIHKQNGGLGNARNVGMAHATGKYIIFLDSDDYWELQTIERLVSEAEKNQTELIAFSAEPFWDGIPDKNSITPSYLHKVQNEVVKNGIDSFALARAEGEYYPSACLRFYLLQYLKNNKYQFDEGILHEDESVGFLSYINAERIECLGERLYKRRYRAGSIMTSKKAYNSAFGYMTALGRILDEYEKTEKISEMKQKLFANQTRLYVDLLADIYSNEKKKGDSNTAQRIRKDVRVVLKRCKVMNCHLGTYSAVYSSDINVILQVRRFLKYPKKIHSKIRSIISK